MRTWHRVVGKWSERLAVADGEQFEREVLPFCRFLWPGMVQAPRLDAWDRRGIDLLVWTDAGPLPCAVQCKGFKVQDIGADQIRQIEDSINKFLESDTSALTYLVVHNRDGRNPELTARTQPLLDRIVAAGKARRAEILDRNELLNRICDELKTRISEALHRRSQQLLGRFNRLFRFSELYVEEVPVAQRELTFQRDAACSATALAPTERLSVSAAIRASSGTRWTLLTGQFGTGKTTSATRAAASSTRPIVLVPCATVPSEIFSHGGTNQLSRHVVRSLELFEDIDLEAPLRQLAGSVLTYLLRHEVSPFVFILDGLDEHHMFASANGLQRLSNQLAEFKCSVILTTRSEHLEALLGDFNVAFPELGRRFGLRRVVKVIELQKWTDFELRTLVDAAVNAADPAERIHLIGLQQRIQEGTASAMYGDLLHHPLFLHFVLEDVATGGVTQQSRSSLMRRWIERKIRRDRLAAPPDSVESRPMVDSQLDTEEFIRRMLPMLEDLAFRLARRTSEGIVLEENTSEELVRQVASTHFPGARPTLVSVLLNSVLTVHSRQAHGLRVGFALRVLHEYLAAAYILRHQESTAGWPESVLAFVTDGPA
jgi:hypothetical protein